MEEYTIAKALIECFMSPNVSDSNGEIANIVDTLDNIARGLHRIAQILEYSQNIHTLKEGI